jgi:hemerythrin
MHNAFVRELGVLRKKYDESGSNIAVIMEANQMVLNWLTNHIAKQDKKIGEYVKLKK